MADTRYSLSDELTKLADDMHAHDLKVREERMKMLSDSVGPTGLAGILGGYAVSGPIGAAVGGTLFSRPMYGQTTSALKYVWNDVIKSGLRATGRAIRDTAIAAKDATMKGVELYGAYQDYQKLEDRFYEKLGIPNPAKTERETAQAEAVRTRTETKTAKRSYEAKAGNVVQRIARKIGLGYTPLTKDEQAELERIEAQVEIDSLTDPTAKDAYKTMLKDDKIHGMWAGKGLAYRMTSDAENTEIGTLRNAYETAAEAAREANPGLVGKFATVLGKAKKMQKLEAFAAQAEAAGIKGANPLFAYAATNGYVDEAGTFLKQEKKKRSPIVYIMSGDEIMGATLDPSTEPSPEDVIKCIQTDKAIKEMRNPSAGFNPDLMLIQLLMNMRGSAAHP